MASNDFQMKNKQFKNEIDSFKAIINNAKMPLLQNRKVPNRFFFIALDISENEFNYMIHSRNGIKPIKPETVKKLLALKDLETDKLVIEFEGYLPKYFSYLESEKIKKQLRNDQLKQFTVKPRVH